MAESRKIYWHPFQDTPLNYVQHRGKYFIKKRQILNGRFSRYRAPNILYNTCSFCSLSIFVTLWHCTILIHDWQTLILSNPGFPCLPIKYCLREGNLFIRWTWMNVWVGLTASLYGSIPFMFQLSAYQQLCICSRASARMTTSTLLWKNEISESFYIITSHHIICSFHSNTGYLQFIIIVNCVNVLGSWHSAEHAWHHHGYGYDVICPFAWFLLRHYA